MLPLLAEPPQPRITPPRPPFAQAGQAQLETVVPKELGAAVLVVEGPLRGHKARLHAKSGEACAVQLEADLSVQRLLLDEVAMYVGPMDE